MGFGTAEGSGKDGTPGVAVGAAYIARASGVGSPRPGGVTVGRSSQAMVGGGGVGDEVAREVGDEATRRVGVEATGDVGEEWKRGRR